MIKVHYPICKIQITLPLYFPKWQITGIWEVSWKSQVLIASVTAYHEMQYYYNNNGPRFRLLHFSGHQPTTLTKCSLSGDEKFLQCKASWFRAFLSTLGNCACPPARLSDENKWKSKRYKRVPPSKNLPYFLLLQNSKTQNGFCLDFENSCWDLWTFLLFCRLVFSLYSLLRA